MPTIVLDCDWPRARITTFHDVRVGLKRKLGRAWVWPATAPPANGKFHAVMATYTAANSSDLKLVFLYIAEITCLTERHLSYSRSKRGGAIWQTDSAGSRQYGSGSSQGLV